MRQNTFEERLTEAARTYSICFLDVGTRGGIAEDLAPLAGAIHAICFEPEPKAALELESHKYSDWASLRVLQTAIGGTDGKAKLYVPASEQSASLLKHNEHMVSEFGNESMHKINRVLDVTCKTIDTLCREGAISTATYMKLDIEGAELELLKGAKRIIETTVAMRLEVSFLEQRTGQPLIWDIVEWLIGKNFEVIDIIDVHRWRRRNIPGAPYRSRHRMAYSKGRVAQCDILVGKKFQASNPLVLQIQATLVFAALGYFDSAIKILRNNPEIESVWRKRHNFSLERALEIESRKTGSFESWSFLKREF